MIASLGESSGNNMKIVYMVSPFNDALDTCLSERR